MNIELSRDMLSLCAVNVVSDSYLTLTTRAKCKAVVIKNLYLKLPSQLHAKRTTPQLVSTIHNQVHTRFRVRILRSSLTARTKSAKTAS